MMGAGKPFISPGWTPIVPIPSRPAPRPSSGVEPRESGALTRGRATSENALEGLRYLAEHLVRRAGAERDAHRSARARNTGEGAHDGGRLGRPGAARGAARNEDAFEIESRDELGASPTLEREVRDVGRARRGPVHDGSEPRREARLDLVA